MSTAKRILTHFASLAFADCFNKALAFIGVAYLARVLKAEGFGKIEFAQAIIVYFMLVANLGLSTFGTREIAKEKSAIKTYVDQILSMKLCLSLLSYALLVIFTFLVRQPEEVRSLLLIYGFTILTFSLTLDWVFQGIERMEYVALARMATQAVYVGGLLLLVKNSEQLLRVPTIRIAAALTGASLLLYVFLKGYSNIRFRFDLQVWKQILRQSIPMGLSFILINIYYTFDTVMLGFMKGEAMVGYYNAAYKVVLLFIGFAGLFGTAIFPVLARSYNESSVKLRRVVLQSSRLTVSLGLPIAVGGTILSRQIVQFIYGSEYQPSVLPLQLLIWSVFTVYFNCTFAYCLLAGDRQREYLYSVLVGAATNLILNFALIPRYGMLGAVVATLICEFATLSLILLFSARIVKAIPSMDLLRALVSSAFMALALQLAPLGLWLKIPAGVMVYFLCMAAIRGVRNEDVQLLKRLLRGVA